MTKDQKKKDEEDIAAARLALEDFASSHGGQIWIRNIAQKCLCGNITFTGNSQTYFNEGLRSIGDGILKETKEVAPEAFASIIKEIY